MKWLKYLFITASAVFGAIPGVTVFLSNIGVPPNVPKTLFSGIVEATGVATLLLLFVNKNTIKGYPQKKINLRCIVSILLFFVAFCSYLFLFGYLVIPVEKTEPVYFPLWANGELRDGLQSVGSKLQLIHDWGRDDVVKVIQESSLIPLQITTIILITIYLMIFVPLTYAFGVLGIKVGESMSSQ